MITVRNTTADPIDNTPNARHYFGLSVALVADMYNIDPHQYRNEMAKYAGIAKRAANPTDQNAQSMWRWNKQQLREAHGQEVANVIIAGAEQFEDIVWQ